MKVLLYVVGNGERTRAMWSVAPEVDMAYWLVDGYREESERVLGGWGRESGGTGETDKTGKWKMKRESEEGDVEDRSKSKGGYKVVVWSEQLPLGLAARIVERWPDGAGQREMREVLTRLVHEAWAYDVRLGLPASGSEDAHAHAVSASELCEEARGLAARACRAAALVQGRALLSSEALALLGAAGAAGLAGAAALS
ncbi:hypothetical protein, partial [Paenibacillus lignilyticus]